MRPPPPGLKDQLNVMITYLIETGINSNYLTKHKSVSSVVSSLLADWKNLPESKREEYKNIYMNEADMEASDKISEEQKPRENNPDT